MGAADIVPGVSGGTVALILGIYQRLLAALSRIDAEFGRLLIGLRLRQAAERIDLRFLALLGVGILVAVFSLAKLMHHLLENQREYTFAAFFGLILASSVLVGRMCRPRDAHQAALCRAIGVLAALSAFVLVSQDRLASQPGLGYTFFSGAIAICAMILPGVSGSYLLLMLGKYHEITGIVKDLPKLSVTGGELVTLAVFAAGCATGLLLFSRLLRWLLEQYWTPTMAALCGFMVGSLYKIWPLQYDKTPFIKDFKDKVFEPFWPRAFDQQVTACLAIAAGSFALVLAIDAFARGREASLDRG